MNFCVDCQFYEEWEQERWTSQKHRCNYVQGLADEVKHDVVTGKAVVPPIDNCYVMRRDDNFCGESGKWWQKKSE